MTLFRHDTDDAPAPTACDKCLGPLDDAPLGSVEMVTALGVWCARCREEGE